MDLASPKAFYQWYQAQLDAQRPVAEVLDSLKQDENELSYCRQMNVAHFAGLSDELDALVERCLQSPDDRVEGYAIGLSTFWSIAKHDSRSGFNTAAYSFLPMLTQVVNDLLQKSKDPFTREVESVLRGTIAVAHFFNRDLAAANIEVSKSLYWATQVGSLYCVTRAQSLLISIREEMGSIGDALVLVEEVKDYKYQSNVHKRFHDRVYAALLYKLGHNQLPQEVLQDALKTYDSDKALPIQSEIQRQQLLLGVGGMEGKIRETLPSYRTEVWIGESMRCIVDAAALARTNQNSPKRYELLSNAVEIWRDYPYPKQEWSSIIGRWIIGLAHLWQGIPSLASTDVLDLSLENTQWFDLRVLVAGLRLEVALSFDFPNLSVERPLAELQRVFDEARSHQLASPEGLAERLTHWHPLAAAFAALAPQPIPELKTATQAVMRLGMSNRVYDLDLPPTYAAELVLRAVNYDLRPGSKFIQAELGSSRWKKQRLFVQYGDVKYWRPSLSAVSLIYGLMKAGYRERAYAVYHEFGVAPYSTADYPMLPLVEYVRAQTSELLTGQIDVKTFSSLLLNYD